MKTNERAVRLLRFGLLLLALGMILAGLLRQEHAEVLQKAVRVCLECIGIG